MNLRLSIIIIKLNSHDALMKKQRNFQTFKCIGNLKDKDKNSTIERSIAEAASSYTCGTRCCDLRLTENFVTPKVDSKNLFKTIGNYVEEPSSH